MPARSYPIARYLSAQMAHTPSFSSDGQQVAFITDISGVPQVWQVGLTATPAVIPWPDQRSFAPDRIMGAQFSPAAGDDRLIYWRDLGGNENTQLFLLEPDNTETALTTGHEDAMHIPGDWSDDGERILFAANRRHPGLFDLYIQSLPDGEAQLVWQNDKPGYLFQARFSPDGSRAAVIHNMSSFNHALYEIELASGKARLLTTNNVPTRYGGFAYAPDGKSLLVNTDAGADCLYIARLDLDTLALEPVVQREWDVDGLALSGCGKLLAYTVNVDGSSELCLLELATGYTHTAALPEGVPGVAGMMTFDKVGEKLAFVWTGANRTYDVFVWDLTTDAIYPVTQSSHGGVPTETFIAPELIHYPTFDTGENGDPRTIPAWLYKPAAATREKLPVIVYVHGGPESQMRAGYSWLFQYFLNNGYAVLAPNVRGSTGYGKAYTHLDDVRLRMDSVADLAHAVHWIKTQPDMDADQVVIYGRSYGGFMVLAALTHYPDLWAAGVDIVGISNLASFLENTSDYRRTHREAEYGSLAEDRAWMESIAPINRVDQINVPLMVIHGANDPRVPVGEARQLVAALEARHVPVEFLVFDDEGHSLARHKNKLVAFPAIVNFLARHLG